MDVGAKAGMSLLTVRKIRLALPPLPEQRHIADALSDVDGLIGTLEKLIAKKRAIMQAAMQQLLTAKIRLPGFNGKWESITLGSVASISKGSRLSKGVISESGNRRCILYGELFTTYKTRIDNIVSFTDSSEGIPSRVGDVLMPGSTTTIGIDLAKASAVFADDVAIGGDIIIIRPYSVSQVCSAFLAAYLTEVKRNEIAEQTQGITIIHLYGRDLRDLELDLPSLPEQEAIATVLSDMDAEIIALERRRDKTKQIKQGMMQRLLTGHVRLINPQAPASQIEVESRGVSAHSWAFNEAVVISTLAKRFGSEQFPLGRKRYTKLSYLLHRHAERRPEGYLKKAAGPYNPKTRYGGPERLAVENGYICEHKSGPYRGFIAADNIALAEDYFEKWYGPECIRWLDQFRFMKNDELELLTTVDMVAEELRTAGKDVDVAAVMDVIRSHSEWQAKLDRPVFSDTNIARAIETSRKLFD